MPPTSAELLKAVETSLVDDKAENIVVIDLAGKTSIADHMVIASGRSQRHVGATAQHLVERLKAAGVEPVRAEGVSQCDWVVIDAGDAIVHLFRPEVRTFYNLEKMWGEHRPESAEYAELIA
jgi:ribosome-associated protein